MSDLVTSKTIVRRNTVSYTVDQTTNGTLYSAILAGTSKLPPNSTVTLVTSGGVRTTKITPDSETTWALSEAITLSTASVSDALKVKTQIVALTSGSTAADIVAALKA